MPERISNWYEIKWAKNVAHVYQTMGRLLKGTYSEPTDVNGQTITWRVAGRGEATRRQPSITARRPILNADRTTVTAQMVDWEANEAIGTKDPLRMSANDQATAQMTCAAAMGRRADRILLEAFDAATLTTIGNGTANISILDVVTAQGQLWSQGILAEPDIFCALPALQLEQLLLTNRLSNWDYVGDERPMLKKVGAVKRKGVMFIPCPDDYFAVPASNQYDFYMWHREAIGYAESEALKTRLDYVPEGKYYLAANDMTACAAVILTQGVRRFRMASNVALTIPSG